MTILLFTDVVSEGGVGLIVGDFFDMPY